MDYSYVYGQPILGGELSYQTNFTSLSRVNADFNPISSTAFTNNTCKLANADPAQIGANCLLRGAPGQSNRVSGEATWKRSITDPYGQVWMPFVKMRADAAAVSIVNRRALPTS